MRALVQRVSEASVSVDGKTVGSIGKGLLVVLAGGRNDEESDINYLVNKITNLRVFYDDEEKFNRSCLDIGGHVLLVSQFTLYADTRKGRRPSFIDAAPPEMAQSLFQTAYAKFQETGLRVEGGKFQAYMMVSLVNDGPVTLMIDSPEKEGSPGR